MKAKILVTLLMLCCAFAYGQKSKTKVIAHRGAWKNTSLPQNSISSLNAALRLGVFGSECDIWMTADSVLVVNHDPHFYELSVETSTYQQLLAVKHPNGESIATLDQFLDIITKQKATRLVLDIKPSKISKERSIVTAQKTYAAVEAARAKKIVDFILFDYDACLAIEKLDAKANIAYLLGDKSPEQIEKDGLWGIDYYYKLFEKNQAWVTDAKERKLTVNVWTVNEEAMLQSFIDQKVDFITTDEPEMALKMTKK
ncbi:glycerophosphodiester phosphodiesterase family protein [Chryseolinea sp. T2]|uniref:glycerophosphodiester phosphodiesterase n=1 Tax=Chryseolinea sp. T2 TaxID=3129255 RepID=UPI00307898EB